MLVLKVAGKCETEFVGEACRCGPHPAACDDIDFCVAAADAGDAAIDDGCSGRPYSYEIYGGTRLSGGRESINSSGGAVYLPTVGRNTLRLPQTMRLDLRAARVVPIGERVRLRATVEAFNLANHVNYSGVEQRAFLVGTPVAGVTPLIFQDSAAIAAEGLNARPFGTYTAAATNLARERQLQLGLKLDF
jgi:hypothetical protein